MTPANILVLPISLPQDTKKKYKKQHRHNHIRGEGSPPMVPVKGICCGGRLGGWGQVKLLACGGGPPSGGGFVGIGVGGGAGPCGTPGQGGSVGGGRKSKKIFFVLAFPFPCWG